MYKPVGSSKTLDRPVLRSEVECAQGSEPTGLVGSRFEGADLFQSQILCGAIYYVFTGLFSYKNNHIQMTYIPLTNWKANFYPFQKCELCSPNVGQFDVMKVESIITIHTKYMVYKPFVQESKCFVFGSHFKVYKYVYLYLFFETNNNGYRPRPLCQYYEVYQVTTERFGQNSVAYSSNNFSISTNRSQTLSIT